MLQYLVIYCLDNGKLKAHSPILCAGSPVLAATLSHDFTESRSRVIEINGIEQQVFAKLLQYIYTGSTGGNAEESNAADAESLLEELLSAADMYQVVLLKEECASALAETLQMDNVTRILVLAHLHSCDSLLEAAMNFLVKNAKEVSSRPDWYQLMEKYPKLCFQATQRMLSRT